MFWPTKYRGHDSWDNGDDYWLGEYQRYLSYIDGLRQLRKLIGILKEVHSFSLRFSAFQLKIEIGRLIARSSVSEEIVTAKAAQDTLKSLVEMHKVNPIRTNCNQIVSLIRDECREFYEIIFPKPKLRIEERK